MKMDEFHNDGPNDEIEPQKTNPPIDKAASSKKPGAKKQRREAGKVMNILREANLMSVRASSPQNSIYHGAILLNTLNLHKTTVQSLWHLSKQQNIFLKEKNYSELFNSRYEKEILLQNLRKWGNEIRYYYESWVDLQRKLSAKERERLFAITEHISSLVEDVLSLEMENRVLLEKRKNELSDELGSISFFHESLFTVFENRN